MTLRGRLVALALAIALLLTATIVVLVRSRTPGCDVAAPRPALPAALRALGDFDQAYDVSNVGAIEDAASRAAAALHGDLIGATAEPPVAVGAGAPGLPDAVVVPLRAQGAASAARPLAGLVVFLRDCQGSAYFASAEDDAAAQPAVLEFPAVSRDQAAARLGTAALLLQYTSNPLRPQWVTATGPARSLAAR